ncbi:MAG: hypothetical protein M3R44_00885 [Candidatus Eremiobacteraeota bacterium]|nr:hypothetical protein [Candidatus Eremiobacteraeota bacterium]
MKRYASVRFAGALDDAERGSAERLLRSAQARVTSWKATASRTYALLELGPSGDAVSAVAELLIDRFERARIDAPPLLVLNVRPAHAGALGRLTDALGGPGRPAGIIDVTADDDALLVELDSRRTPLALVVALIDVELAVQPGRTIEPLLGLDDENLAAFTSEFLGIGVLDASRIIETHVAALEADIAGPQARAR